MDPSWEIYKVQSSGMIYRKHHSIYTYKYDKQ